MGDDLSSVIILPVLLLSKSTSISTSKYNETDYANIDACAKCCIPLCCFPCWTIDKLCKKKSIKKSIITHTEKEDYLKEEKESKRLKEIINERNNIILLCKSAIGIEIFELIERGSHNTSVINHLKTRPEWVLKYIFEDLKMYFQMQCGKARMDFLEKQVGYTPKCTVSS
jgi:hypothetical protein